MKVIFDAAPLITCCKYEVSNQPIIDFILKTDCQVIVPDHVSQEVAAGRNHYPDADIADTRIRSGDIEVQEVVFPNESVLDLYGLGQGEKSVIILGLNHEPQIDHVVTDDKLAYIVCDRIGLSKIFLLDFLLTLAFEGKMEKQVVKQICRKTAARYSSGMIQHTLQILDKGKRKWLK